MHDRSIEVETLLAHTERIGIIGSPSTTIELTLDILGTAVTRKLVGELAMFQFMQDGRRHYALGQITELELRNTWLEEPTARTLVRLRGAIDSVSGRQDTHTGKMTPSAVFSSGDGDRYSASIMGTIPPTGTVVSLATDGVLNTLLNPYRDQIFYFGRVYGSQPRLPLWFKHFGHGERGIGEAYHIGIFGKTGSGKTALGKMVMVAYARHPEMAIVVIDPQGEFAADFRRGETATGLPIGRLMQTEDKQVTVLSVRDLVLDRWELFQELLFEGQFLRRLTINASPNRETAASIVREHLQGTFNLNQLHERTTFNDVWTQLQDQNFQRQIFVSPGPQARLNGQLQNLSADTMYTTHWLPLARLFQRRQGAQTVDSVLQNVLNLRSAGAGRGNRNMLVLDVSREGARLAAPGGGVGQIGPDLWNEHIQALVIRRLLDGLTQVAERAYQNDESLNTLVVIDEAQRLAPRGHIEDPVVARVRDALSDAARTTRKYGLGWLFISQSLSSIDSAIVSQLRVNFFGFGHGMGQEYEELRRLAGSSSSALRLYQTFRDPQSSFDLQSREYPFMTVGPVSPLSFSDTPLFFTAYNTPGAFLEANGYAADGRRPAAALTT